MLRLFGNTWVNSLGREDFWAFDLEANKVCFSFYLLFDAETFEYDHGWAVFSKDGFRRLLEAFFEKGDSALTENDTYISITKHTDYIWIYVGSKPTAFLACPKEVPKSVLEILM